MLKKEFEQHVRERTSELEAASQRLNNQVTGGMRTEETLREAHQKAQSLFDSNIIGVILANRQRILEANDEFLKMTGYTGEDLHEGRIPFREMTRVDFHHTDDRCILEMVSRIDGRCSPYEKELIRKDGRRVPVLVGVGLLTREPLKWVSFVLDITEQKKAEAKRIEIEKRLLYVQKLESLGVMAGGIAHDFNNLLMIISGSLELALLDLAPDSVARQNIDGAMQASRRAEALTRQMLAYLGNERPASFHIDLSQIVHASMDLFQTVIDKRITLNFSLASKQSFIEVNPAQVQQVIMNLLSNSSEAIGEIPGVINLATGLMKCDEHCLNQSLVIEKPPPGQFAYIEVSDTGCGMDEEIRQKLFDPFFTTKFMGRGLGMSVVMGIVRSHKGAILMESVMGHGTTIRVLFPVCEAESDLPATAPRTSFPKPGMARVPFKVLVVDDEEAVRNLCVDFIRHLGYGGIGASGGEEGLKIFEKQAEEISLVILDLAMPKMDGMTAFRELKRIRPDVRVILCSGYREEDATQKFIGEGLAGFIQKPYRLEELKEMIEEALQGFGKIPDRSSPR